MKKKKKKKNCKEWKKKTPTSIVTHYQKIDSDKLPNW